MLIEDNFLCLTRESEFTNKVITYFYNRLKLFLLMDHNSIKPFVKFTSNATLIKEYYGDDDGPNYQAFYDDDSSTIVMNSKMYINGSSHVYADKDFMKNLPPVIKNFEPRYIIPLQDIYHELNHHIQFCYTNYQYMDLLEGSAELFSVMLTGQCNLDYIDESLALWYLSRQILKMDALGFYTLTAKMIINSSYPLKVLTTNKTFLKLLSSKYKNNIRSFFNNMKKDLAPFADYDAMIKDINKIHNLIFYRY